MAYEDFAVDPSGMGFEGGASNLAATPPSYAIPENYGNPKNKIYNLTAGPEDAIRLKGVDGTIFFEGKGPEAAAKAAQIVQQLGKEFGTQATWILDKQTAGGDWKQVSQDTVGQKKTTALNAFLNVAAPIAGSFIPGLGPVLGAALGSAANSALQNKNSAQALKDAAISAAGAYVGGKLVPGASSVGKDVASLTSKFAPKLPVGTLAGNAVQKSLAAAAEQAAAQAALSQGIATTVVPMVARQGLTSAVASGLGAGLGNLVRPNFNPKFDTIDPRDLEQADTADTTAAENEIVVPGVRPTAPTTVNPLTVAGGALGAGVAGVVNGSTITQPDVNPKLDTTDPRTPAQKLQDWVKANPLQAASLGLTALSGLAGGTKGGKGSGTLSNMPGNIGAAGTTASLPSSFTTGKLPPPGSMFTVNARTPAKMNMTTDEWLRYGMGPEKSFFTATPPTTSTTTTSGTTGTTPGVPATGTATPTGTVSGGTGTSATGGNQASNMVSSMANIPFLTANTPQASSINPQVALAAQIQAERDKLARSGVAVPGMARGGSMSGNASKARKARSEFAVHGAGTGRSDDIPAVLSDGEYVLDAETVAMLGDGSNKAGAKKLDQFRVNLRRHKGANLAKGRISVNAKSPEKYLAGGRVK